MMSSDMSLSVNWALQGKDRKKVWKVAQNSAQSGFMIVPAPQLCQTRIVEALSASISSVPNPGFSHISASIHRKVRRRRVSDSRLNLILVRREEPMRKLCFFSTYTF